MAWSDPVAIQVAQPIFKVDVVDITGSPAPVTTPAATRQAATSSSWKGDFKLVLPSGWRALRQNDLLVSKLAANLRSSQLKLEFFGVKNDLAANVNILKGAVPSGLSFAQYEAEILAEVKRAGAVEPIRIKRIGLAGSPGVLLSYSAKSNGRSLWFAQYSVRRGTADYVITGTTTAALQGKFASVFEQIARSFRFTSSG
jgi:hypothetical protein